ncbi:hypothetical protein ACFU99_14405 [Streptomyces sp. NPDC057654]|uniref:Orn/Lys/Arg family decarboxylase n=1 Tax=Streptomyces sp. NPDC057654 TaxID=3346196 RepID=UPI0036C0E40C
MRRRYSTHWSVTASRAEALMADAVRASVESVESIEGLHADDAATAGALIEALRDLSGNAQRLRPAPVIGVPPGRDLRLEQVCLARYAFFGPTEAVPLAADAGRVAAEILTPYPPGIPAVLPGERLTDPVLWYLGTGVAGGMNLPDAMDPTLRTVRVRKED